MRHKLCRSFHPWCPGVKTRCLFSFVTHILDPPRWQKLCVFTFYHQSFWYCWLSPLQPAKFGGTVAIAHTCHVSIRGYMVFPTLKWKSSQGDCPGRQWSSWWLLWSSLGTLKLVVNVSSDDQGSCPGDLSVSANAHQCKYYEFYTNASNQIYRKSEINRQASTRKIICSMKNRINIVSAFQHQLPCLDFPAASRPHTLSW